MFCCELPFVRAICLTGGSRFDPIIFLFFPNYNAQLRRDASTSWTSSKRPSWSFPIREANAPAGHLRRTRRSNWGTITANAPCESKEQRQMPASIFLSRAPWSASSAVGRGGPGVRTGEKTKSLVRAQ